MDIVFKSGPWKTFFSGKSLHHEVQLLSDSASTVLSLVWDVKGKETVGLALEWIRVLVAKENPSVLVEKADFDCWQFGKKEGNEQHWFVLVKSFPTYAPLDQQKIDLEMDKSQFVVHGNEKKAIALGKALNIPLKPLEEASENERAAFFDTPFSYKLLSHGIAAETEKLDQPIDFGPHKMVSHGEVLLGIDRQEKLLKEPLGLFRRTIVSDGKESERLHAMHILVESALLGSIPCVEFSDANNLQGIQFPNQQQTELKNEKFNLDPIGFPFTVLKAPEQVHINLAFVEPSLLMELFRIGNTPAANLIERVWKQEKIGSFSQLADALQIQSPLGENTAYQIKKAVRLVRIMDKAYPNFFGGSNTLSEIVKEWGSKFARLGVVLTAGMDERLKAVFVHALVRELKQYCENRSELRPVKCILVLPEAKQLFPRNSDWKIHSVLAQELAEASASGLGSFISTERISELNDEIVANNPSQISMVRENDAGIRIEHRKPYRVSLRPALSSCSEKENPPLQNRAMAKK